MMTAGDAKTHSSNLATAAPLLEELDGITRRLPEIDQELTSHAMTGPLPKSDISERLLAALEKLRANYEDIEDRGTYDIRITAAIDVIYGMTAEPPRDLRFRDADHVAGFFAWLLAPHLVEKRVAAAVSGLTYDAGLSADDRRVRREALAAERSTLIARHEVLVDEINALGGDMLHVQHLPDTAARRDQDKRTSAELMRQLSRQRERLAANEVPWYGIEHVKAEVAQLEAKLGLAPQEAP